VRCAGLAATFKLSSKELNERPLLGAGCQQKRLCQRGLNNPSKIGGLDWPMWQFWTWRVRLRASRLT
jgi:hypothetical protein